MKMRDLIISVLLIGIPVLGIYWIWNNDRGPHCDDWSSIDRALCERTWMIDQDIEAQRSVMNAMLEKKRLVMIEAARKEIDAAYKELEGSR